MQVSRPSSRARIIASSATRLAVAPAGMPSGGHGPAAELQHDVLAEKMEKLMHLPGVDAAGRTGNTCAVVAQG